MTDQYYRKTFTVDGKRYTVYGKTPEEAAVKADRKKDLLSRGYLDENMTVEDWAERWKQTFLRPKVRSAGAIKAQGTMTEKSFHMYEQMLRNWILPEIGHYKLKKIRDAHLQQILNNASGMSKSHLTKLRIVLQGLFGQAARSRLITFDPSDDLRLPAYTEGKRRSLQEWERSALLGADLSPQDSLLLRFLLWTGLRPSEAKALRWRDVDLAHGLIHVWQAVESGTDAVADPKTAAGDRYVPIPPQLRSVLEPGSPFDLVFLHNGRMMTDSTLRTWWKRVMTASGLFDTDLTIYCLRHTYCTDLQQVGV